MDKLISDINSKLLKMGMNYDEIPTAQQEQLKKIESAIDEMASDFSNAKKSLDENTVNIQTVSKRSGISRKTFYNNPVLKKYVELSKNRTPMKQNDADDSSDHSETSVQELNKRVTQFLSTAGIDSEELQADYDKLLNDKEQLEARYEDLLHKYNTLQAENKNMSENMNHINTEKLN